MPASETVRQPLDTLGPNVRSSAGQLGQVGLNTGSKSCGDSESEMQARRLDVVIQHCVVSFKGPLEITVQCCLGPLCLYVFNRFFLKEKPFWKCCYNYNFIINNHALVNSTFTYNCMVVSYLPLIFCLLVAQHFVTIICKIWLLLSWKTSARRSHHLKGKSSLNALVGQKEQNQIDVVSALQMSSSVDAKLEKVVCCLLPHTE